MALHAQTWKLAGHGRIRVGGFGHPMPQQTHRRPADSGTGGRGLVEPTQWQSGQGGLALYNRCRSHIRDLYTGTAAIFRRLRLVRPGKLEAEEEEFIYDIEKLIGSDP